MNKLGLDKRTQILMALVEGNSLRSTSRMTGAAINTVMKLLVGAGQACIEYQDKHLRNLSCKRIQADEVWSFCYAKQRNVPEDRKGIFGYGDVWTWTALCADSKLIASWLVGPRDAVAAREFLFDLSLRVKGRFQLTTDGLSAYPDAVERVFGREIDYAMLVKIFGAAPEEEHRYSPPQVIGVSEQHLAGSPNPEHVSTSYVERQNLTMRMNMRRFTRLTNGFSKKVENHAAAIALHFMNYNFARVHKSLRMSPAMAAGVTKHLWSVEEIAALVP